MGFKPTTAYTRMMPLRDADEHDVVNFFSKDVTGVAGELVKIVRSNPSDSDGFSATPVGATFDGTVSLRYEVKDKVTVTRGGESVHSGVLGFTLFPTLETDENGIPLKYDERRRQELQAVISGQAVPVLTRGIVQLFSSAYVGTPQPGFVGVPWSGGNGLVAVVDPSNTGQFNAANQAGNTAVYRADQVIGHFLSSSGNTLNGFALFKLEL